MKLSIELDIEIDYEDIEDEGDHLTAPYSATEIRYDTEAVLKQVDAMLHKELHYTRTERRPEPMSPREWMKCHVAGLDKTKEVLGINMELNITNTELMELMMKQYAQHYTLYR